MGDEKETGIKWWMRYVIVPLIGGAGVLGVFIAYIGKPPATPEKPSAQSQIVQAQSMQPQNVPSTTSPAAEPPAGKKSAEEIKPEPVRSAVKTRPAPSKPINQPKQTPEIKPQTPAPEPDRRDLVKFFISDEDDSHMSNTTFSFEYGKRFSITWDATPVISKGKITMVWGIEGGQFPGREDESKGLKRLTCRNVNGHTLTFNLMQTLADGTSRNLGELDVTCEKKEF